MKNQVDAGPRHRSLACLAQQLRDGPLRGLTELHRKATRTPDAATESQDERLEQLTELALLSLAAMEQFQAFTRELKAQIADLVGAPRRDVH